MCGVFAMTRFTPLAQDGPGAAEALAETPVDPGPLLTGPTPALWVGFGAGVLVFFLVLLAIIRSRVVRPAIAKQIEQDTDFFEPAGADADITFEDPNAASEAPQKKGWFGRKRKNTEAQKPRAATHHVEEVKDPNEAEISIERPQQEERAEAPATDAEDEPEISEKKKPNRSPFAGLFSRRKEEDVEAAPDILDEETVSDQSQPVTEPEQDTSERQSVSQEIAEHNRRAEAEAAAAAKLAAEQRGNEEHKAQLLRQEKPTPGQVEAEALKTRTSALEQKVTSLSDELETRLQSAARTIASRGADMGARQGSSTTAPSGADIRLSELIDRRFADMQKAISRSLDEIRTGVDAIGGAEANALSQQISELNRRLGERSAGATAAKVQLSDLIQNALPPNAYAFQKKLPNGRTADCAVKLPHKGGDIAIDAQFPVEAFDRYIRGLKTIGNEEKAENEFRSAVLQHVVGVSEKYIIPGETASSALMFIPSETIYAEIQARFPDLVQDSYNARVWMVAPTSLMATLHAIRELVRDVPATPAASTDAELLREIKALRSRVDSLEGMAAKSRYEAHANEDLAADLDRFAIDLSADDSAEQEKEKPALSGGESAGPVSMSREEAAFERLERNEALGETPEDEPAKPLNRPPFPLR